MPLPPNNRAEDHPQVGNYYLTYWNTSISGSYHVESHDPNNIFSLSAKITQTGDYSVRQTNGDGHTTEIHHGSVKSMSEGKTETNLGHNDVSHASTRESNYQGKHEESGGDRTAAHDGVNIQASRQSQKSVTQEGNGHHYTKGDQSFVIDEGGLHYAVTKDFTATSSGTIHLSSQNEMSITSDGGNIGISVKSGNNVQYAGQFTNIVSGQDITINSMTKITLVVGSSSIVITPDNITIKSSRVDINP